MALKKSLVAAAILAAATYGLLWMAVLANWAWLDDVDTWTLRRFHEFGINRPGWVASWRAVSDILTVLRVAAVLGIIAALVSRRFRTAGFLFVTVIGMGLVTATAKAAIDRPRPESALTAASSSAFPSGHALGVTVAVLAFATVFWPLLNPTVRRMGVAFGAGLVFLVSLARVVLDVHHPSDVMAGWALGFLYYLGCLVLVRPWITAVRGVQESDLISPD